jgi:hypothetical protein
MRIVVLFTGCMLVTTSLVGLTGCGKTKTSAPPSGKAAVKPHHHHHGASRGPHGGYVIGFDVEKYHAELTRDEKTNRVGVYILGDDAATAAPIEAQFVAIQAKVDDKPTYYKLPAVAQPGEPAGKSSYFELVSEPLFAIIAGKSGSPNPDVQLSITVDGKTHIGDIDVHEMVEPVSSQGTATDDALLWIKELNDQGYEISLGHHGVTLLAGGQVEPAVQIKRDGKPVADAKVFNALLDANGKTVLAQEVATVYEPPTTDEPSHYAQSALKIPPGTREAVIRFRIVLPEGKGERTYDVPVAVK